MTHYYELQCDGLIGPTHNYAGLSFGNIASEQNADHVAYPKKAALQGLEKMRLVHELGCKQIILPPPMRPNMALLDQCGITNTSGTEQTDIIRAAWSASSMWSANAATISSALHTEDGKLHMTAANLASSLHRSQEAAERHELLQKIFGNVANIHKALPACMPYTDEGAANHMHLCPSHDEAGVEVFVYGRDVSGSAAPKVFPARQTKKACETIAHMHQLPESRRLIVQQHPDAIDAGVFHNDVIAMSNQNVMIYHDTTFYDEKAVINELHEKAEFPLMLIRFGSEDLPLIDAVKSYFYNSQLLSLPNGRMAILAPKEVEENDKARRCVEQLCAAEHCPIDKVHYLDVRESMRNGGGPACLRLRVTLNADALASIPETYIFSSERYNILHQCISEYYPEQIAPSDIYKPELLPVVTTAYHKLAACFS